VPAGSDSMMPVVKDPLMAAARGGGENVVRQVVVVPFSSDRPGDSRQQSHTVQASDAAPASTMASTPEMQEEMRKLIDAARSAVADLQAVAPAQPPPLPAPVYEQHQAPSQAQFTLPPELIAAAQASMASGQQATPGQQQYAPSAAENAAAASQALQAATAMARATSALGQMAAAASSGFSGMLPITHAAGPAGSGATRRIQAVVESLITRKGLNLRLAGAITQAFEGAELKASDYAAPNKLSKESAGRELRQAVEAGLLQLIKYPQGEAGFRADPALLKSVAEGLGQPVNAAQALTPETIISSLSAGQSEGTVTIMFTDVEGSTQMLSSRGFTLSHEIMKAYESIMEDKINEHAGRRIKGLGDGVMVSFGSTRHAVECAIE